MEIHVFLELVFSNPANDGRQFINVTCDSELSINNSITTGMIDLVVDVIDKGVYYIRILECQ